MTPALHRTPTVPWPTRWSAIALMSALALSTAPAVPSAQALAQSPAAVSAVTAEIATSLNPGRDTRRAVSTTGYSDVLSHAVFVVPDALPVYYSAEARRQTDGRAYRARVVVSPTGGQLLQILRVDSGGSLVTLRESALPAAARTGTALTVDLQVNGSNPVSLKARTRTVDAAVTDAWQLETTDAAAQQISAAGLAGMHAYLSSAAPRAITLRTTELAATAQGAVPPTPPAPPAPVPWSAAGSAPIGSTAYAVPAGAVYVAPNGSDANPGTVTAPKASVRGALGTVPAGGTIVLRAGTYFESVTVPSNKPVTIQAYPREAVWFDATTSVGGFNRTGVTWSAPWRVHLDHSPTDVRGAPDYTTPNWQFLNPSYPMAAHPDQVWVAGAELRQVRSLSAVTAGTFFVDEGAERLHLGGDPTGKTVRSSVLPQAFVIQAAGTTLRGIGVRNYASSVPDQGVVRIVAPNVALENVVVANSSTGGVGFAAAGGRLRNVTISGSGQIGVLGHYADDLSITRSVIQGSNDERFNTVPVAGGVKLTCSRKVLIADNVISGGFANGFWSDMAGYDMTITGNTLIGNTGRGIFLELSSKALVANNLLRDNGGEQITVRQTDRVRVWNNTIVGSSKAIQFARDSRTQANTAYARDKRRPFPDPEMPWTIGNSSINNNIIQSSASYLLDIEDFTHQKSAAQLGFTTNGNVYSQQRVGTPGWVVVWARAGTDPAVYGTVAAFSAATAQERQSFSLIASTPVTSSGAPVQAVLDRVGTVALSLPTDVAAAVGRPAGTKHLGAWR